MDLFRHSHATYLIEHGANMKDVQERLGHSKLSTTMDTYSHVTKKMKTDTVSIVESFVIDSKKRKTSDGFKFRRKNVGKSTIFHYSNRYNPVISTIV